MNTSSTFNYAANTEIQPELLAGESLLWAGVPQARAVFHGQDVFMIPFSLLWGGFAIFWEWGASNHFGTRGPVEVLFALWGIPFVVIGQYMIWGRFVYTAWKKGKTFYGVTNKRVLVINKGWNRKVTDGHIRNLDSVSHSTRYDGMGTIEFAPEPAGPLRGWGRNGRQSMDIDLSRLAFIDIEDARSVYQIIQSQRKRTANEAAASAKEQAERMSRS